MHISCKYVVHYNGYTATGALGQTHVQLHVGGIHESKEHFNLPLEQRAQ